MPDMNAPMKLGADIWNQYTDWPAFKAAHLRAEALGYESLWTMDHVYPPMQAGGRPDLRGLHGHVRDRRGHVSGDRSA